MVIEATESRVVLDAKAVAERPVSPERMLNAAALGRNVFRAAERAAEFFDHMRTHYRESRRTPVEIETRVRLILDDGTVFDAGRAVILNISPSGALLGKLLTEKCCFPAAKFKVELVLRGGEYEGIGIEAKPVRFDAETGGLGVKFEEIFVNV
ncbi:MAG: hypothetical protein L6R28_09495 [Planctomycetes bacterium]|nr:hypothetical protein [Planctomycetota bacterium]